MKKSTETRKAAPARTVRRAPRTVRLGMIGLGPRGESLVAALKGLAGVEVSAICDVRKDRIEKMLGIFRRNGKPAPTAYTDFGKLIADPGVEGVLIPTSWNSHLAIAAEAMAAIESIYTARRKPEKFLEYVEQNSIAQSRAKLV